MCLYIRWQKYATVFFYKELRYGNEIRTFHP